MPADPPRPDRRELKQALLWSARGLVGGGGYAGPVRVRVEAPALGERVEVRPSADADGLADPGAAAGGWLAAHFLSPTERRILAELAARQPAKAATVKARAGLPDSEFYAVWKNLRDRGLVVGEREEYRPADGVAAVLGSEPHRGAEG